MLIWFAETTIVAGILAVVAAALSSRRQITPSVKHVLWLVVLIKFVTPPLVAWPWASEWRSLGWPAAWNATEPAVVAAGEAPSAIALDVVPADRGSAVEGPSEVDSARVEMIDASDSMEVASAEPLEFVSERDDDDDDAREDLDAASIAAVAPTASAWPAWVRLVPLSRVLLFGWIAITATIAIGQVVRIARFRRRLRSGFPAPDFLVDEADRIGRWLGVSVPELLAVDDLGTPMLWCLGRPQLLLPTHLIKTLSLDRWRGILTHELAHLRRRDQWVARLELAAGLIWWWNPLYWLVRARLDAEAELACDAWVVWALPKDRLTYAEVLFDICSSLSPARPIGARVERRRLGPILRTEIDHDLAQRRPLPAIAVELHRGLPARPLRLPTWSAAKLVSPSTNEEELSTAAVAATLVATECVPAIDDDDDKDQKALKRSADDEDDDDADDDDDDDEDDDEQDEKALERAKAKAEAAKAKVDRIKAKLDAARAKGEQKAKVKAEAKAAKSQRKGADVEVDIDTKKLEKEIESKFGKGSDFEKQMEKFGEEIEKKFGEGSEFEKQMEKFGEEIEKKFGDGSDFEKQMEKFGEEIASKFGDGSDFAKKMEAFGKELAEKFGDGSEFVKKLEGLGKELEAKLGPGSEFEKKMKELGEEMKEKYGPDSDFAKKLEEKVSAASKAKAKGGANLQGSAKDAGSRIWRLRSRS